MPEDIYMLIQRHYMDLQRQAQKKSDEAIAELYSLHPFLKELNDEISHANSLLIKAQLKRASDAEKNELLQNLELLKNKKDEYISENSINMSIFVPSYKCTYCNDTGKLPNGQRCHCFSEYYSQYKFESDDMQILERENFSTFDINVFPEVSSNGTEQRKIMERIKNALVDYCSAYPDVEKKNIILVGLTGTGKSFLLNCMARALYDKQFPMIRQNSYRLLNKLFDLFISDSVEFNSELERICETEILIIDDFGTELLKENFTLNTLYYIFDRRMELNKATIVSTNLSPKKIEERYSERIMSRLFNTRISVIAKLSGDDIRTKR